MTDEEKPEESEVEKVTPEDRNNDDPPTPKTAEVLTSERFAKYAETIKHEKTAANLRREVSTRKRLQDRYNRLLEESCAFEDLSIAQAAQLDSIRSQVSRLRDDLSASSDNLSRTNEKHETDVLRVTKKWKMRLIFLASTFMLMIALGSSGIFVAYKNNLIKFGTIELEKPK